MRWWWLQLFIFGVAQIFKLYTSLFPNHLGNAGKAHEAKDEKVDSKVQHSQEENMNKGNSNPDIDDSFHTNVTTRPEEISSLNQINDCLFVDSLESGIYINVYKMYNVPCTLCPSVLKVQGKKERCFPILNPHWVFASGFICLFKSPNINIIKHSLLNLIDGEMQQVKIKALREF